MGQLEGRVAVITAGARGIGLGIAKLFAAEGAKIVIGDVNSAFGEEAAQTIVSTGGDALFLPCDAAKESDLCALVERTVARHHTLDIVVQNAGYFPTFGVTDLPDAELQKAFAINILSLFRLSRFALPHLKKSKFGRVLATSSVVGNRSGLPMLSHYGSTKAAVNGFIKCAAVELGAFGITVNGVEPGLVRTERFALDDETTRDIGASVPLSRLGVPADIATAMLFLAADSGAWITGQTIVVDGGGSLPHPSHFVERSNKKTL